MGSSLAERDKKVIWHPYTPQKYAPDPIPIVRGEGSWIIDESGNRYLDAISSWWVTVHGHANAYIAEKIYKQALQLEQVIFAGFTHEPAVRLAEKLLTILPGNFQRIFYSDNGSTATEVAVKMALQYWKNKGQARKRVIALANSYHGDTFGAMSVSERSIFTEAFDDFLFETVVLKAPQADQPFAMIDGSTEEILEDCACIIYEPLIQGAGGMLMYDAKALDRLLSLCRSYGVLCIADEVMTGFGRTGEMFASSFCNEKPDIICLSKGLTGGTMAMGVTACTENVHEAFVDEDVKKTFYHGHSYTANPIACAAALASLDLFEQPETMQNIQRIVKCNQQFAAALQASSNRLPIENIRQTGTIVAFDVIVQESGYSNPIKQVITQKAMEKQVYLRPLGNTVYLMPPYCTSNDELQKIYGVVMSIVEDLK